MKDDDVFTLEEASRVTNMSPEEVEQTLLELGLLYRDSFGILRPTQRALDEGLLVLNSDFYKDVN